MGLFKKKDPDAGLPALADRTVTFAAGELVPMLGTAGGDYPLRPSPQHKAQALAIAKKHLGAPAYPEWWKGTGYLEPGVEGGVDVIWIRVLGHRIDKLSAESRRVVADRVTCLVPVKCEVSILSPGTRYEKPSVGLSWRKK